MLCYAMLCYAMLCYVMCNNTRPGIETLMKLLPMERDLQNCINLNYLSDVTFFHPTVLELISILIASCSHVVFPTQL